MVFLNINGRSIYTSFCDFVNKATAFVLVELCLLCIVLCWLHMVAYILKPVFFRSQYLLSQVAESLLVFDAMRCVCDLEGTVQTDNNYCQVENHLAFISILAENSLSCVVF